MSPIINPINFFFITLLFLIIFNLKLKNNLLSKLLRINIVLLLIISFIPIGKIGIGYLEKDYIIQDSTNKIVNIIVLSGSEDFISTKKTGKLSLNTASIRLITSIDLANKYKDSTIYFIGGNGYIDKNSFSEISVAQKFYKAMNFDLNRINFVGNSRNTIENFNEIKKLYLEDDSSVLITSAFHMKRALIISKEYGINLIPYAVDYKSIKSNSLINIYQDFNVVSNLSSFNLFFREILGIIVFKIFY